MKKGILLNSNIASVIAKLGHTDHITLADAGLPIPASAERIDLAVTHGLPDFMSVLRVTTQEMQVEKAILAEEISKINPQMEREILAHLQELEVVQGNHIEVVYCSHENFKQITHGSKAVIRTGECSPYANVILCSGVTF
ncbi:D-ribose pyranase [Providencia rustigianii]|uniref:D-ribose pyranase n=2 Tax=Providencia rustigianii TaxID=158850 RepID=D1P786_9GAMM|nr:MULTISPECIES: D-ribose pyranase [Providencia]EFB70626.1 RbsD/FucU transport family protein [Providencia rustigianii DSM 4541]MTC56033.1 D-ribose pyranase [Providencia rustigianii]SPY75962.1 D-ribose pyranase [Providencia rustigianii]SUC25083.1 D-ribose pyranase [Providencia rustigianii]SUC33915.1 D-ribose pyranase [Providencia rustigianii]